MAGYNNADYAVSLPSVFGSPGEALDQAILSKERKQERLSAQLERDRNFLEKQREFDLRMQDRNDMEDYRKAKMITDLTDLSKHQTGSDVANAVGSQKVSDIVGKYTSMAKGMSYADLLNGINKDMSSTVSAMDAMKNELETADKGIAMLKQKFPELNISQLMQEYRADVVNRRLGKNNEFVNPLEVVPSDFEQKLADTDFLSKYIQGNSGLVKAIQNPTGLDESTAFVGTPDSHMKYQAKIPFWKTPNFSPEQLTGGFLKSGVVPELKIKESILPMTNLPSNVNKKVPFKIVDKEVLDRFIENPSTNLELTAAARRKFPQYDSFNATEKEYAKSNVLHDHISELDQLQYHPTGFTKASRTSNTINLGDRGTEIKDVYAEVKGKMPENGKALSLNKLSDVAQSTILDYVRKIRNPDATQANVAIWEDKNGEVGVYTVNKGEDGITRIDEKIAPLSYFGTNTKVNTTAKQKQELIKKEAQQKSTEEYTNITETNKGKIGVKNGKWYDIKTGKPIQ